MSAGFFLLQCFSQKIIDVVVAEGLLELFLAGRVDPLADYNGLFADLYAVGKARNVGIVLDRGLHERKHLDGIYHLADVIRRRAAAAAHNVYAELSDLLHDGSKIVRIDVINRHAVLSTWKPCVGVYYDREGAALNEALCDREHLLRTEAAVDADSIDLKAFEHRDRAFDSAAGKELTCLVVDHRDDNGQVAYFFCSNYCCLGFIRVAHRLDNDDVAACFVACFYYLSENIDCLIEGEISHGLQELSCRADVDRYIGVRLAACFFSSLLTDLNCSGNDLGHVVVFEPVGAESVCIYDV